MKRIIIATIETDGHSASSVFIATTEKAYQTILRDLLYYEDKLYYNFKQEHKMDDNTIEQWYQSDMGEMAILVKKFNAYREIENAEFYTRTG